MKLNNLSLPKLALLAVLQIAGRGLRTVQGVVHMGRSWRCAWILAERK